MGFLQSEKVADAKVVFSTVFNEALMGLSDPDRFWEKLATLIQIGGPSLNMKWLGDVPGFSEWLDERKIGKVRAEEFVVSVKKWASGLEVAQDDIDDDNLGLYRPKIAMLAQKASDHRLARMVSFLANGFATTEHGACYDGVAFFSKTHPFPKAGTWSNMLNKTLDDTGAFNDAMQLALEMLGEDGQPIGSRPTILVCGPKYRSDALALVKAERDANGASNTNFGAVDLHVSPYLTGDHDDKWFLLNLSSPVKPLALVMRKEVEFDEVTEGKDKFMKDVLYFGANARYEVAYGLPQIAIGSDGTS